MGRIPLADPLSKDLIMATDTLPHPARRMPYDDLVAGLAAAVARNHVYRNDDPETGLSVFMYSKDAMYDRAWTPITLIARGLVLHLPTRQVVATPFPKFFNAGEPGAPRPDGPFDAFEKADGSMISIFRWQDRWLAGGRKRLRSRQMQVAQGLLDAADTAALVPGTTYLAEYVGPENRVVVKYPRTELIFLAAYDAAGYEIEDDALAAVARATGYRAASRIPVRSLSDLLHLCETLPADTEGYVIRYPDRTRLKVKGNPYLRIHALIANCRPTAIWELLRDGIDPETMRRDLPEETHTDFDTILAVLTEQMAAIVAEARVAAAAVAHLSDREIGQQPGVVPPHLKAHVFALRRGDTIEGKTRALLIKQVRPVADVLPGYTPSWALKNIQAELAA